MRHAFRLREPQDKGRPQDRASRRRASRRPARIARPIPCSSLPAGPGSSIVADAADIATDSVGLRARRDLVLVDQRGTGGSHPTSGASSTDLPTRCSRSSATSRRRRPCDAAATSARRTRTSRSTRRPIAVDDLDDVRAALGAEQINLVGGSYGTRAAQEYMRRHPDRVRSATLFGLVPPSEQMPQHFARDAQHSLDAVVAECAADAACRRRVSATGARRSRGVRPPGARAGAA